MFNASLLPSLHSLAFFLQIVCEKKPLYAKKKKAGEWRLGTRLVQCQVQLPTSVAYVPPLSQEVAVTEEEDTQASASAEVVALEERIAELGRSLEGLGRRVTRLEGQKEMLEKYSNGMFAAGEKSESADLVNQKTVGECPVGCLTLTCN